MSAYLEEIASWDQGNLEKVYTGRKEDRANSNYLVHMSIDINGVATHLESIEGVGT